MKRYEILQKAIDTYGADKQLLMAIEEMSELTKAICKENRARNSDNYTAVVDNLKEEVADVKIMIEQLCMIFNFNTSEIENYKVERLAKRLGL